MYSSARLERDEGWKRVPVAHIQQILSFYYMSRIRYLTSWHFQFEDGQKETGVFRSKHQGKLSKNNSYQSSHYTPSEHLIHLIMSAFLKSFLWLLGPHTQCSPPTSLDSTVSCFLLLVAPQQSNF